MYFHDPQDRQSIDLVNGIHARTFWGDRLMLVVVDIDAEAVLPNHSHPHEQGGIVLKGELELTIGGEKRLLKTGEVYLIPAGVEHSAVAGIEAVQVLDIFSPIREDLQY
ncbi:MAG: cupin domain-containing protein [Anaerolineales bacterium]